MLKLSMLKNSVLKKMKKNDKKNDLFKSMRLFCLFRIFVAVHKIRYALALVLRYIIRWCIAFWLWFQCIKDGCIYYTPSDVGL